MNELSLPKKALLPWGQSPGQAGGGGPMAVDYQSDAGVISKVPVDVAGGQGGGKQQ